MRFAYEDIRSSLIKSIIKLYLTPECGAGGPLHIVLDDYNIEDENITWCLRNMGNPEFEEYNEEVEKLCYQIGGLLLTIPEEERLELVSNTWVYANRFYKRNWSSNDLSVDSDRLFEWDSEKYNRLSEEVFGNTGQYFFGRYPEEIQLFLQRYFNRRILITGIMERCNVSNGYPYWTFYYKDYGPLKKENQNAEIQILQSNGS